jgi:hypothetical protein
MATGSALLAARNNAAWCDAVCRASGGTTELAHGLWRNASPSPPYFPNAISVECSVESSAVERALRSVSTDSPQVGVKDSFCTLDLSYIGFSKAFEASWIWRDPVSTHAASTRLAWGKINSVAKLQAWEHEWWPGDHSAVPGAEIFSPALLDHESITFFAAYEGSVVVAGAAITETEGAVGLTCTFYRGPDPEQQRRDLLAVITSQYPGRVILGYQSGHELAAMKELGFREVGPLRVWLGAAPR